MAKIEQLEYCGNEKKNKTRKKKVYYLLKTHKDSGHG
jgi:hypothetical protein